MKKDNYKTDVIFRKVKNGSDKGTIEAFFPYDISDYKGNITCYAHVGCHSGACWEYVTNNTMPAKANEYTELFEELESIGYNLKVVKRRNYKRYLQSLYEARNK